jgi:hypothetical protein
MLFEECDFVTFPAACVTFPEPDTIPWPDRKRIAAVVMERTSGAFLRVFAESEPM